LYRIQLAQNREEFLWTWKLTFGFHKRWKMSLNMWATISFLRTILFH
jgi:hypothetical protein